MVFEEHEHAPGRAARPDLGSGRSRHEPDGVGGDGADHDVGAPVAVISNDRLGIATSTPPHGGRARSPRARGVERFDVDPAGVPLVDSGAENASYDVANGAQLVLIRPAAHATNGEPSAHGREPSRC
jgi:hypothetical protein